MFTTPGPTAHPSVRLTVEEGHCCWQTARVEGSGQVISPEMQIPPMVKPWVFPAKHGIIYRHHGGHSRILVPSSVSRCSAGNNWHREPSFEGIITSALEGGVETGITIKNFKGTSIGIHWSTHPRASATSISCLGTTPA